MSEQWCFRCESYTFWVLTYEPEGWQCSECGTVELVELLEEGSGTMGEEPMLRWFSYEYLPDPYKYISKPFCDLAEFITDELQAGPERTVALRKLLEAKDAAVRARVTPGG